VALFRGKLELAQTEINNLTEAKAKLLKCFDEAGARMKKT
jgi:hypothetical protein